MAKHQRTTKKAIKHATSLAIEFGLPDAGWIFFKCLPLTDYVTASCYEDPFPAMIAWLESIVDGADVARWSIGQEGSVADFICSNAHSQGFDSVEAQLIYVGASSMYGGSDPQSAPYLFSAVTCPVKELVHTFYGAFRAMAEHPKFDRREWLSSIDAGGYRDVDLLVSEPSAALEEHPSWKNWPWGWQGVDLQTLRSAKIEAFLSGQRPEQRQLHMPWR